MSRYTGDPLWYAAGANSHPLYVKTAVPSSFSPEHWRAIEQMSDRQRTIVLEEGEELISYAVRTADGSIEFRDG